MGLNKFRLLLRRQDHHSMLLVWITKRCEYLSANSKVWMIHVRAFRCVRHAQSEATKFGGGHDFTAVTYVEEVIVTMADLRNQAAKRGARTISARATLSDQTYFSFSREPSTLAVQ